MTIIIAQAIFFCLSLEVCSGMTVHRANARAGKGLVFLPKKTLHITMPTVDNKVTENITPEQAQKLLNALDEEADQVLASLVRLALFTGMRRGALLSLQWDDLDFERGFITLRGDVAKKQKTETIPITIRPGPF